jgi:RNA ligase (TIGR02306 family)
MSSLIVKVSQINKVIPHSNPEVHSLDIAEVEGWQCLVKRGSFKTGDKAVYFPPDTLLPVAVSDELGVTNYLDKGRIRTIKLKGEMSFGLVVPPRNPNWEVGTDVAAEYGATKYMPPTPSEMLARSGKTSAKYSDMLADHPLFWKYTDLENIKHYPGIIADGEEVIMTEKLHGCCHRLGIVYDEDSEKPLVCVGSRNTRRKPITKTIPVPKRPAGIWNRCLDFIDYFNNCFKWPTMQVDDLDKWKQDWYFHVFVNYPSVEQLLTDLYAEGHKQVILYGESYGPVQSMHYGSPTDLKFAAFDILVDGKYLDYNRFTEICGKYGIPICPIVYSGPYSIQKAKEMAAGNTLMGDTHIREGVVVKPVIERSSPRCGRVIFKVINDDYLLAKEPDKKGVTKVTDMTEE